MIFSSSLFISISQLLWSTVTFFILFSIARLLYTIREINFVAASCDQKAYGIIGYVRDSLRGVFHLPELLDENFHKTGGSRSFVIPNLFFGPMVVVSPRQIAEFRFVSDDALSFHAANHKILQPIYTIPDPTWLKSYYPIPALRKFLSRRLAPLTPEIAQEIAFAFNQRWGSPNSKDGWIEVPLWNTLYNLSIQSVTRMFAGEEASRSSEYTGLIGEHIVRILSCGMSLNLFPDYVKPFVSKFACFPVRSHRRVLASRYLRSFIEERKLIAEKRASEKDVTIDQDNDDFLQVLVLEARKQSHPACYLTDNIISRVLAMYMVSIQTPSITSFSVVEQLIKNPEYVLRLREEAMATFSNAADPATWSKAEIDRLPLHDSFIRESMRCSPMVWTTMRRNVMKPEGFTFSDGTHVPSNFEIAVPTHQVHYNKGRYENANEFDPSRFAKKPEQMESEEEKLVTPTLDFLGWGTGLHACTGRFYAAVQMKITLAYLILNYDLRETSGGAKWRRSLGVANAPIASTKTVVNSDLMRKKSKVARRQELKSKWRIPLTTASKKSSIPQSAANDWDAPLSAANNPVDWSTAANDWNIASPVADNWNVAPSTSLEKW